MFENIIHTLVDEDDKNENYQDGNYYPELSNYNIRDYVENCSFYKTFNEKVEVAYAE